MDGGASVDILFHESFHKDGIQRCSVDSIRYACLWIYGAETKVEGIIQLPMTMGQETCEVTYILNFLVIKVVTSYIAILGGTRINSFKVVASTYHMKIKFPVKIGTGMEKEDQKLAQNFYIAPLRADEIGGKVLPIEDIDVRENKRG